MPPARIGETFEKGFRFNPANEASKSHKEFNDGVVRTGADRKGPGNPGSFGTEESEVRILSPRPKNRRNRPLFLRGFRPFVFLDVVRSGPKWGVVAVDSPVIHWFITGFGRRRGLDRRG